LTDVLSTGYRSLDSCPPRSGLERSDFVLWRKAVFKQSADVC
jgi:hypothetical protein